MKTNIKPELLSPAGDLEKLIMAVTYGADAVYLSGENFGMRAKSAGFSNDDIEKGIKFAHSNDAKVYITCNTLPREYELNLLPDYLSFLQDAGADALIIADLGILSYANKYAPKLKKHISTQLGVVNSGTANMLYELGADTVVLARELSLDEIKSIRDNTPANLRLECFVHGAMCVSFSGRCLLSNYLTGRDANRGKCAQPCRWKYHLMEESKPGEYFEISEDNGTFILNSKDLCMIDHIPDLLNAGISSLKIEGRMKSAYYTACVTNAYRAVLDCALKGISPDSQWLKEVNNTSHRPFSTGFFYGYPGQHYGDLSYAQDSEVMAVVDDDGYLVQRNKFFEGDKLELISPGNLPICFTATELFDDDGKKISSTPNAMMKFKMKLPIEAKKYSIVRKPK